MELAPARKLGACTASSIFRRPADRRTRALGCARPRWCARIQTGPDWSRVPCARRNWRFMLLPSAACSRMCDGRFHSDWASDPFAAHPLPPRANTARTARQWVGWLWAYVEEDLFHDRTYARQAIVCARLEVAEDVPRPEAQVRPPSPWLPYG